LGRRLAEERFSEIQIDSPERVMEFLGPDLRSLEVETLRAIYLNTRHMLIKTQTISTGTINESIAHPREILRPAIAHSAYALIIAHNHPSGDPSPSKADRQFTTRLNEACQMIGIRFLDHVIIGRPGNSVSPYFSFREAGMI
jgi:DNA repair protein RadC